MKTLLRNLIADIRYGRRVYYFNEGTKTITVHPINYLGGQTWEPEVSNTLSATQGGLFIDVGANAGYYSWLLRNNYRKIVAFEPLPQNVKMLRRNLARMTNLEIWDLALSDREGTDTLKLGQTKDVGWFTLEEKMVYNPTSAGLYSPHVMEKAEAEIPVRTTSLDKWLTDRKADLVKVDVEGAEWRVLAGASKSLHDHRISRICVELHDKSRMEELAGILADYGFETRWLDGDHIYGILI